MNKKYEREDILEIGIRLIKNRGYANTGIQDVLKAAGIPKGSFYNFFESKEAFALEAVAYYKDAIYKLLDGIDAVEMPACTKIKEVVLRANDAFCEGDSCRNSFLLSLANEVSHENPVFSKPISNCFDLFKEYIIKWVEIGQQNNEIIDAMTSQEIATYLLDAYHGAIMRMKYELNANAMTTYCDKTLKAIQKKK